MFIDVDHTTVMPRDAYLDSHALLLIWTRNERVADTKRCNG